MNEPLTNESGIVTAREIAQDVLAEGRGLGPGAARKLAVAYLELDEENASLTRLLQSWDANRA